MPDDFAPLPLRAITCAAVYAQPAQELPQGIEVGSPALAAMTDFRRVPALTVAADAALDLCIRKMVRRRVRLLFAVDDANAIAGLVTATDILGDRPRKALLDTGGTYRQVAVRDVMTPCKSIEALDLAAVTSARVGDIVATLDHDGRQHALVVERQPGGGETICGLFSRRQIAGQLHAPGAADASSTFAALAALIRR